MKTIVTGGTGFIGSHLVKKLLDREREVVIVSDFSAPVTENLLDLGINPSDVEIRRCDLSEFQQAFKAVEGAEMVYHLAARVGSLEYLHNNEMAEVETMQTNLLIDANLFRACLKKEVKKLVYASSVAVYPMQKQFSSGAFFSETDLDPRFLTEGTQLPQTAGTTNPGSDVLPDGGYGWAKLLGELQLFWMKGVNAGIARIFNTYGPNEPLGAYSHIVADLIKKSLKYPEEAFNVYGDGGQTRDFVYVSDCAAALAKLGTKLDNSGNSPIIVNIGSGKPASVREIADIIIRFSGKKITPNYIPKANTGPVSRTAIIKQAKKLLDWQPEISLEEGLSHTYHWAIKRLSF